VESRKLGAVEVATFTNNSSIMVAKETQAPSSSFINQRRQKCLEATVLRSEQAFTNLLSPVQNILLGELNALSEHEHLQSGKVSLM